MTKCYNYYNGDAIICGGDSSGRKPTVLYSATIPKDGNYLIVGAIQSTTQLNGLVNFYISDIELKDTDDFGFWEIYNTVYAGADFSVIRDTRVFINLKANDKIYLALDTMNNGSVTILYKQIILIKL